MNNIALLAATPGVPEVVGLLFPNLPNFIAHVLATIVLIIILSKLVYKPFRKSIDNRRAEINKLLDDAILNQTTANKDRREAESVLKEAKNESLLIIKNARVDADAQKMQILETASNEANNLQNHAKNSILREKAKAQEEIRKSIIDVAFAAAAKVLEAEVSSDRNTVLIDQFITDLDHKKDN